MKKVIALTSIATVLLFTSCKETSISVFSSKNVEAAMQDETKVLDPEQGYEFKFEPLTNENIYIEDNNMNISIQLPNVKSDLVNELIIDWAKGQIASLKKEYASQAETKKITYTLDYDKYELSNDILNIKYKILLKIDEEEKQIIKTVMYNTKTNKEIKIEYTSEKAKQELKTMVLNTKQIFSDEKVNNRLVKNDYGDGLDFKPENYQTFTIDDTTKTLILYFDEEQIGKIKEDSNIVSISVPLRFLINSFMEEAPEIYELYKNSFNNEKKYVALTFDDGPHPNNTDYLLDGLKELDVKATFFVVGYSIDNYPSAIKRMSEEGHEIGNHSEGHAQLTKLSKEDVIFQIQSANRKISELTGEGTKLIRPPYGAHNDLVDDVVKDLGMSMVFWNVDPLDWKHKDVSYVYNNIVNVAKDGDIILLHDIQKTSIDAALKAIPVMEENGYVFLTVSELLEMNSKLVAGEGYYYGEK